VNTFRIGGHFRRLPDNALRFIRAEARERWRDLSSEDVLALNGSRGQLILFLQYRYGFGLRRATKEADDLMAYVAERIQTACEPPALPPVLDMPA
jgi:hypothetical protein